ncbi:MAG: hypothetical protein M5U26_19785 [Planctomycetota bacterium]|nr:hypothetical protein [Planctomycetota bacterium]
MDPQDPQPGDPRKITTTNTYQLLIETEDVLGNTATHRALNFVVDREAPVVRSVRLFNPIRTINTDNDTYYVAQDGAALVREHTSNLSMSSVWRLAAPVGFAGESKVSGPVKIYAEDIAGNVASESVAFYRYRTYGVAYGNFEDGGRWRPMAGDSYLSHFDGIDRTYTFNSPKTVYSFYDDPEVPSPQLLLDHYFTHDPSEALLGPSITQPAGGLLAPEHRIVLPREDQMSSFDGLGGKRIPGRILDLILSRDDGIPASAFQGGQFTTLIAQLLTAAGGSQRFLNFNHFQSLPQWGSVEDPNYLREGRGPLLFGLGSDKEVARYDAEAYSNLPSPLVPSAKNFAVRFCKLRRTFPIGWGGYEYKLIDAQYHFVENFFGGMTVFNPRDKLNFLRIEPSTWRAGQRITVFVKGAELALPGQVVEPDQIGIKVNGQNVAVTEEDDPESPESKIVVHKAVGVFCNHRHASGYVDAITGGIQQCLKLDLTIGADVPAGLVDLVLTTPQGMQNTELKEAAYLITFQLLADANHDGLVNGTDETFKNAQHGVVSLDGFNASDYPNHPAPGARIQIKPVAYFDSAWKLPGTVKLEGLTGPVRVFDAATEGNEITTGDLQWPHSLLQPVQLPESLYLECAADVSLNLKLVFVPNEDDQSLLSQLPKLESPLRLTRLSNGLGGSDGIAPHAPFLGGYASVGLTRGNLHFGAVARTYHTPVLGPDVAFSYNHLDAIKTGMGPGWRSNYDMQIFDGSVDANLDGEVDVSERQDNDLLALIGADGRRYLFKYLTDRFVSDPKTGLRAALVNADPENFESEGEEGEQYLLILHDNLYRFFDGQGRMTRIADLLGRSLRITRNGDGNATCVRDEFGRSESLPLQDDPDMPMASLSGRQLGLWYFQYDGQAGGLRRMREIKAVGNFSHGSNLTYAVAYDDASRKVKRIDGPTLANGDKTYMTYSYQPDGLAPSTTAMATGIVGVTHSPSTFTISPTLDALLTLKDPEGLTATHGVNAALRQIDVMSFGPITKALGYDSKGNLTSSVIQGGASASWEYLDKDKVGANLLTKSTSFGADTTYEYYDEPEKFGLLKKLKSPSAVSGTDDTEFEYGEDGFLAQTKDATTQIWRVAERNLFGQPLIVLAPSNPTNQAGGRKVATKYNNHGLPIRSVDMMGYVTQYRYDLRDRTVKVVEPGGTFTEAQLDPLGRILMSRDSYGRYTSTTRDALGRPTQVDRPGIAPLVYEYNNTSSRTMISIKRNNTLLSLEEIDRIGRTRLSTVMRELSPADNPGSRTACRTIYNYHPTHGLLESATDPRGNTSRCKYNSAGQRSEFISAEGLMFGTQYDGFGRPHIQTAPGGNNTTLDYKNCGVLESVTSALGAKQTLSYDKLLRVAGVQPWASANTVVNGFDVDGLPNGSTDLLGRDTQLTVDTQARTAVRSWPDIPNNQWQVAQRFNHRGHAHELQTATGVLKTQHRIDGFPRSQAFVPDGGDGSTLNLGNVTVDNLDRTTNWDGPGGTGSSDFDPVYGHLVKTTDGRGYETRYEVDPGTGDVNAIRDDFDDIIFKVVTRDRNDNVTEYRDGEDRLWTQTFNADNQVLTRTAPDGTQTVFGYKDGYVHTVTAMGGTTTYTRNNAGLVTQVTAPNGLQASMEYDETGRLKKRTQGGLTTEYVYEAATKRLKEIHLPGNRTIHYEYYADTGLLWKIIDPRQKATEFTYDSLGRQKETIYPDGKKEINEAYYNNNLVKTYKDRGNRQTDFVWDARGWLQSKTLADQPQDKVIGYTYHGDGRLNTESLGGETLTWDYDLRGRLSEITGPATGVSFDYYKDNSVKSKTYAGRQLAYSYNNGTGRLEQVQETIGGNFTGVSAAFSYDAAGRVNGLDLPASSLTRTMALDPAGRMKSMTQVLGDVDPEIEQFAYAYDGGGRMTRYTHPGGQTLFGYDNAGRLKSEFRTGPDAYKHSYAYDASDNRTQRVSNPSLTAALQSDALDEVPGAPVAEWSDAGDFIRAEASDGEAALPLDLGADAYSPYTVKVRPDASEASFEPYVSPLAGLSFGEDANGRYVAGIGVREIPDGQGGFELARRVEVWYLPAAGTPELAPFGQGAPQAYGGEWLTLEVALSEGSATVTVAEDPETVAPLTVTLEHGAAGGVSLMARVQDAAGNLVAGATARSDFDELSWWELTGGASQTSTYAYNDVNQLTAISGAQTGAFEYDPAGVGLLTSQTLDGVTTEFGYDRLNRQTSATVGAVEHTFAYAGASWMRTSSASGGSTTNYLYDGFACVKQSTGTAETFYFVPGTDALLERSDVGGVPQGPLAYAQDGLGNITGLWDGTAYAAEFRYDAFGNRTVVSGGTGAHASSPGYRGQLHDAGTGEIYLRNRQYNPALGRFTAWDPIGYAGGLNTYNYCAGDPVNRWDPMGTDWKVVYPNGDVAKTFPDDQKDAAIDLAGKIGGEVAYFERGGAGDPGDNITGIVFSAARSIPRESVKIAIPTRAGFTAYSQMGKLVWVPNDVHQQMVARLTARNVARDAERRRQEDIAAFNEWAKAISGANNARLDAAEHLFKEGAFEVLTDAAGVGLAAKAALLYKSLDRANDVRRAFDRADDAVDTARALNRTDDAVDTARAENAASRELFQGGNHGLRGTENASKNLINAVEGKGRTITYAREGSDELRYLNAMQANANVGGEDLRHILLRMDPKKIEVLEEFLHGTQQRLGLVDRLGVQGAERHVKEFMIRHQKLLGISDADVGVLRKMLGE